MSTESASSQLLLIVIKMKFAVILTLFLHIFLDIILAWRAPNIKEVLDLKAGIRSVFNEYDGFKTSSVRLGKKSKFKNFVRKKGNF